jgi:hypothetical protein
VQGYWTSQAAQKDFESKLVLNALQAKDIGEREKALNFLVTTHLLRDPEIVKGIMDTIKAHNVPRLNNTWGTAWGVTSLPPGVNSGTVNAPDGSLHYLVIEKGGRIREVKPVASP